MLMDSIAIDELFEERKSEITPGRWIVGYILGTVALLLTQLFDGYVVMKTWEWLIVPSGYNPLPYAVCVGGSFLIGYTSWKHIPKAPNEQLKALGYAMFVVPVTTLIVAYFLAVVLH